MCLVILRSFIRAGASLRSLARWLGVDEKRRYVKDVEGISCVIGSKLRPADGIRAEGGTGVFGKVATQLMALHRCVSQMESLGCC